MAVNTVNIQCTETGPNGTSNNNDTAIPDNLNDTHVLIENDSTANIDKIDDVNDDDDDYDETFNDADADDSKIVAHNDKTYLFNSSVSNHNNNNCTANTNMSENTAQSSSNSNNNSNSNNSNQNLTINEVGSYAELRLKRISVSKCLLNFNNDSYGESYNLNYDDNLYLNNYLLAESNNNNNNNKGASGDGYYRNDPILLSSFNSLARTRSRSRSRTSSHTSSSRSSSSSSSFSSSLFINDSFSNTLKKKLSSTTSSKKIKLSILPHYNSNTSCTGGPNCVSSNHSNNKNTNNCKAKKSKSYTNRFKSSVMHNSNSNNSVNNKINRHNRTGASGASVKKQKNKHHHHHHHHSKRNKFSKLHEDHTFSKSYMANSLSNFSITTNSLNFKRLKCLLVGDARVGKSALMYLFLKRIFQTEYQPTIVDDYEVKVNQNGETYTLNLFDTAGQEDWETLRVMAYPDTDVILLCFSVVRPDSMENILTKWITEITKFIPNALIVLVGTQVDLRDNNQNNASNELNKRYITTRDGEELRQKIKAYKYIECSAFTQLNIKEVFEACIDAYTSSTKKVQPSCFQSLFRRFTNTIRRRFNFRRNSNSSMTSNSKTNNKNSSKSMKSSRKYLHEK